MSRLPAEVVKAIGGPSKLTARATKTIEALIAKHGVAELRERAIAMAPSHSVSADRALTYLAKGRLPSVESDLTLRLDASGKFVRLESTNMASLIAAMPEIEKLLRMLVPVRAVTSRQRRHGGRRSRN
jgi:hypothetical protein